MTGCRTPGERARFCITFALAVLSAEAKIHWSLLYSHAFTVQVRLQPKKREFILARYVSLTLVCNAKFPLSLLVCRVLHPFCLRCKDVSEVASAVTCHERSLESRTLLVQFSDRSLPVSRRVLLDAPMSSSKPIQTYLNLRSES